MSEPLYDHELDFYDDDDPNAGEGAGDDLRSMIGEAVREELAPLFEAAEGDERGVRLEPRTMEDGSLRYRNDWDQLEQGWAQEDAALEEQERQQQEDANNEQAVLLEVVRAAKAARLTDAEHEQIYWLAEGLHLLEDDARQGRAMYDARAKNPQITPAAMQRIVQEAAGLLVAPEGEDEIRAGERIMRRRAALARLEQEEAS